MWVMNYLPCQHRGRCGSKTSDYGHQRRLDEHPEKMRQRRETVALAAYAASHPGLYGSAHGKTARLSIEVPIIFGGLFIFIFQLADGRHVCLWDIPLHSIDVRLEGQSGY